MSQFRGLDHTTDVNGQLKNVVINTDNYLKWPQSPPNHFSRPSPGDSWSYDSSWPLFSIYSKMAEDDDDKMAEHWEKDADSILIFTGLFSAAIAALAAVSIQDLRPNSQDTSAFYLGNIYQVLSVPNTTGPSVPSDVARPPPFSPPNYAIWVNVLWFLSLTMTLCCAIMATLLQQWARRYIRITQPSRCSPERRARIRALFADSTDIMFIKFVGTMLTCVLHLALLLFFIGLFIFLFRINRIVFGPVMYWMGCSVLVYVFFTVMPLFQSDGLLYTPLSLLPGSIFAFIICLFLTVMGDRFSFRAWKRHGDLLERDFERFFGDLCKVDDRMVAKLSSQIDVRVLEWTIDALGEDDALERFFDTIPGFFDSRPDNALLRDLPERIREKFKKALYGFLDRTFSSNTLSESDRSRRLVVCLNAAYAARDSYPVSQLLHMILQGRWDGALQSINIQQSLRRWDYPDNDKIALYARSIVARIIARERECDNRLMALAVCELGVSELVLRDQLAHGESVLLANLIHVTRRMFRFKSRALELLNLLTQFEIQGTLPGLQRDFCALWNEIVLEARGKGCYTSVLILRNLRHIFIALHQGTDALPTAFSASTDDNSLILYDPQSYPLCRCSAQTSRIQANQSGEPSRAPPATQITFPQPVIVPVPVTVAPHPGPEPDTSPRPAHGPPPGDVPGSLQPVALTATFSRPLESNRQQNTVAPSAAQDIVEISSTADPIPQSIPNSDATVPHNAETPVVPPIVVSDSPTSSSLMPRRGMPSAEPPPSAPVQPGRVHHPLVSLSLYPAVTRSYIAQQHSSPLDAQVTTSVAAPGPPRSLPPIPMEVIAHRRQSAPPAPGVDANTLDVQRG